ncbi:hypothetical protein SDC9_96193 [bioreactor metagenome]|uniref:Uncharacterized protein n=1 Tax=bioreactor metagenome TaxID=1076179 RepID=A0A645AF50_9ZZZZ
MVSIMTSILFGDNQICSSLSPSSKVLSGYSFRTISAKSTTGVFPICGKTFVSSTAIPMAKKIAALLKSAICCGVGSYVSGLLPGGTMVITSTASPAMAFTNVSCGTIVTPTMGFVFFGGSFTTGLHAVRNRATMIRDTNPNSLLFIKIHLHS